MDKYGREWPNHLPHELCPVCGQPNVDNRCDHKKPTKKLLAVFNTYGIWREKKWN